MKQGNMVIAKTLDAVGLITFYSPKYIEIMLVFIENGISGMNKNHYTNEEDVKEEWLVAPNPAFAAECMGMLKSATWFKKDD